MSTKRKFFCEKSRNMTFSWIEWKIYIKHFQIDETTQQSIFWFWKSINTWICENDRESTIMTINSRFFCSNFRHLINCRFSFSSFRHLINRRFFCLRINQFIHQMIFTIFVFLNVETSFDKKKNRNHTHIKSFISNKQINIQNIKQKNLNFVSFRICFSDLFVSMTLNEFATTTNESVSMKFLMSRLERFQNVYVRFFTFLQSTSKDKSFTYTIRKQWHE